MFVSPHLDDAILSCGGLIFKYIEKGAQCDIINIFNKIDLEIRELSSIIKEYISEDMSCDIENVNIDTCKKWNQLRKRENDCASKYLKCNMKDLEYVDAIFRHTYYDYIYKNEEQLFGEGKEDDLIISLYNELRAFCYDYDLCYFPKSIGKHVDHIIANKVGNLLIDNKIAKVCFYYEQPYLSSIDFSKEACYYLDIKKEYYFKIKAIEFYQSQLQGLFKGLSLGDLMPKYEIYSEVIKI